MTRTARRGPTLRDWKRHGRPVPSAVLVFLRLVASVSCLTNVRLQFQYDVQWLMIMCSESLLGSMGDGRALARVFRSDPCGDPALARIALANTHLIIIIPIYCYIVYHSP
jgi:hypothetical protein